MPFIFADFFFASFFGHAFPFLFLLAFGNVKSAFVFWGPPSWFLCGGVGGPVAKASASAILASGWGFALASRIMAASEWLRLRGCVSWCFAGRFGVGPLLLVFCLFVWFLPGGVRGAGWRSFGDGIPYLLSFRVGVFLRRFLCFVFAFFWFSFFFCFITKCLYDIGLLPLS